MTPSSELPFEEFKYNEKGELRSDINQIFLSKENEKYFLFNKREKKTFSIFA